MFNLTERWFVQLAKAQLDVIQSWPKILLDKQTKIIIKN